MVTFACPNSNPCVPERSVSCSEGAKSWWECTDVLIFSGLFLSCSCMGLYQWKGGEGRGEWHCLMWLLPHTMDLVIYLFTYLLKAGLSMFSVSESSRYSRGVEWVVIWKPALWWGTALTLVNTPLSRKITQVFVQRKCLTPIQYVQVSEWSKVD